jgi:N-acetylglucosamine-6-phosphate deacetylase
MLIGSGILICIINAKILTPLSKVEGIVAVQDGIIQGVHARLDIPADAQVIDAGGLYLSPGFIDMHVHGGGGCGVMDGHSEDIVKMCQAHAQFGTTSILPTTLAAPFPILKKAMDAVRKAQGECTDCHIAGIHLEGPFLSKKQRGAQSEDSILVADEQNYKELLDYWDGIRIMGAAPEVNGCLKLGRELQKRNIIASIAHSDASYDQVTQAILYGYSDVTHIYSGCSSIVRVNGYRVPGVVEAGLLRDELSVQVIADLKHLPPALLMLIYKCKGADNISLITDGLEYSASELKEGTVYTQKNGVETVYEDGVMKLMDRQAFAGSVATCNRLVRNMVQSAEVPLLDAVKMATATPAKKLNIKTKGMIAEGYDADLVLFDENIQVKFCMVSGKIIKNLS